MGSIPGLGSKIPHMPCNLAKNKQQPENTHTHTHTGIKPHNLFIYIETGGCLATSIHCLSFLSEPDLILSKPSWFCHQVLLPFCCPLGMAEQKTEQVWAPDDWTAEVSCQISFCFLSFIFFLYVILENNSRRQNASRMVKILELRRKCSLKAQFPFPSKHMLQGYQNPNQNYSIYCTMHDRAGGHSLQRNTEQEGLCMQKGCTGSVRLFLKIFIYVFGCVGS